MKINLLLIWFMVAFFAFFIFIGALIYKSNFASEIPCLEEIAENYCEDNGFLFDQIYLTPNFRRGFLCREDSRQTNTLTFLFLEEEIERCKK